MPIFEIWRGPRELKTTEQESMVKEKIIPIRPYQLIPIMKWGYGDKDWDNTADEYWKDQWEYKEFDPKEKKEWGKETHKIYQYLKSILYWSYNKDSRGRDLPSSDTKGHLDPLPGILKHNGEDEYIEPNWKNPVEVDKAIVELAKYYFNEGQPDKTLPLILVDKDKENDLLGVVTLRWRGDKYVPKDQKIASIERLIINPQKRDKGAGARLASYAIDYAFNEYAGYQGGQGAKEIRIWIMADREAGNYSRNESFFSEKFDFEMMKGLGEGARYPDWKAYANEKLNLRTNRNARWWRLTKEKWEEVKMKTSELSSVV